MANQSKNIKITQTKTLEGHRDSIYGLAFDRNSNTIFSGGAEGYVVMWDHQNSSDGTLLAQLPNAVYCITIISRSQLVAGTSDGSIYVFDWKSKLLVSQHKISEKGVYHVMRTALGIKIATGDGSIVDFNLESHTKRSVQLSNKAIRYSIQLNDQFAHIASDGYLYLAKEDRIKKKLQLHTRPGLALMYNPFKNELISGGIDAMIRFTNIETFNQTEEIPAHLYHIHDLKLHPSLPYFISGSLDKSIKLWDAVDHTLLKVIELKKKEGHANSVNKVLWIDDKHFISCSDDRTIKVWNLELNALYHPN